MPIATLTAHTAHSVDIMHLISLSCRMYCALLPPLTLQSPNTVSSSIPPTLLDILWFRGVVLGRISSSIQSIICCISTERHQSTHLISQSVDPLDSNSLVIFEEHLGLLSGQPRAIELSRWALVGASLLLSFSPTHLSLPLPLSR